MLGPHGGRLTRALRLLPVVGDKDEICFVFLDDKDPSDLVSLEVVVARLFGLAV